MIRLVLLLAILAAGLLFWYKLSNVSAEKRNNLIFWGIVSVIVGGLVLLAATGKLNWITALIGSIAAMVPRALGLLKYLPLINRFYQQAQKPSSRQSSQQSPHTRQPGAMTRAQAYEILGLKPGASREDIITAHKRMMQKMHPDRGGSDYLAAEINQAKDILLS